MCTLRAIPGIRGQNAPPLIFGPISVNLGQLPADFPPDGTLAHRLSTTCASQAVPYAIGHFRWQKTCRMHPRQSRVDPTKTFTLSRSIALNRAYSRFPPPRSPHRSALDNFPHSCPFVCIRGSNLGGFVKVREGYGRLARPSEGYRRISHARFQLPAASVALCALHSPGLPSLAGRP